MTIDIKNGYAFFWAGWPSNWYMSPMTIGEHSYNCAEQYMMAYKACYFNDVLSYDKIMKTADPKLQKKLGRAVDNYNDDVWSTVRYNVVLTATIAKYRQNEQLQKLLLDTGDAIFVEASPYDKVWGVGLKQEDPLILDPKNWQGLNLLGKAITEAREIIRKEI